MLCQNCGKNEATTHIKQVINGDTAERHLCSECAEHLGYGDAFSGFGFDVAGLFGNFFGDAVHSLGAPRKVVRCPKCGSSFNDIVREGRVGCAECYKVFYNELKPSLQRIHGQIHHSGKIACQRGRGKNRRKRGAQKADGRGGRRAELRACGAASRQDKRA